MEFGVQSEDLKKKIKTPRGTTVILGASFCGDSNVYNAVNFGVTLSGESYLFSFNESELSIGFITCLCRHLKDFQDLYCRLGNCEP